MKILIRGGLLIEGLGGREGTLEWIEIKDGFIVRIDRKGSSAEAQAHEGADRIIEAHGLAVCPCLVRPSASLHGWGQIVVAWSDPGEKLPLPSQGRHPGKKVLHYGVTTVRDLGG